MTTLTNDRDERPRPTVAPNPLGAWPYGWPGAARLVAALAAMAAVWVVGGFAVTELVEPSAVGSAETDVSEWFEESRSDVGNEIATIASVPSDTPVTILIMIVLAALAPLAFARWHEWAFLATALVLEVSVFLISTFVVNRARPPVERLSEHTTNSWPSGHVAAAVTLYVGLLVVARWRTADSRTLTPFYILAVGAPLVVVLSRLYLGMHYVSDVIGGALLGLTAVAVTRWVFEREAGPLAVADGGDR